MKQTQCPKCDNFFSNNNYEIHTNACDGNYIPPNKEKGVCKYCNEKFNLTGKSSNFMAGHMRWCTKNPNRPIKKIKIPKIRNGKHSEETKAKMSANRKQFLKDNPEKHPWRKSTKFISGPCEKLKEYLTKQKIVFVEEWQPLKDRYFSIDIAFPDQKVGIEINGNQHYNKDGTLQPYYQDRHNLIVASGWTLYEIHYLECFNPENILSNINLKIQPDYSEYFILKEQRKSPKNVALPLGMKSRLKADAKYEPMKQKVLQSNIDFTKFGWVKEIAPIIGIKEQVVCRWMKRYLPEFYDTCYKRKSRE